MDLEQAFFDRNPSEETINENWSYFKDQINQIVSARIPTKMARGRHDLPWLTHEAKHLARQKNRAHTKAKHTKSDRDWKRFRLLRKSLQKMLKVAHQDYINNLLDPQTDTNSRNLWRYLKATRQDNVGVSTLKSDGKLITDPAGKAEALNQQFSSAFTREDPNNIPELGPSPYQTMAVVNISRIGVEKLLARLNPAKASGPDELSACFLKETAAQSSPMYAFLFQQSTDQGTVPEDWKTANVAPIFKKGDCGLASNYRPPLCFSCKVLEHIIVSQMRDHMDKHNILVDCQHGFRSRHSCVSQLIITVHDLASSLNQKHQTDMAILDFSKAFDRVPHTRLKAKLDNHGIHGNTLKWISSFLDERTHKVMVDGSISNECPVLFLGGSVFGPTLFLLYINDITHQLDSRVRLFADDCLIYREIKSPDDHYRILQQDLDRLKEWSHQ